MKSSHVSGVTRTYHWRIFDAKTKQLVHPTPWSSLILPFKMMPTENTMNIVGNPWENPSIFTRLHFYIKHQKKNTTKIGFSGLGLPHILLAFSWGCEGLLSAPGSIEWQRPRCPVPLQASRWSSDWWPPWFDPTPRRLGIPCLKGAEWLSFSPRGSWKGRVLWKRIRA